MLQVLIELVTPMSSKGNLVDRHVLLPFQAALLGSRETNQGVAQNDTDGNTEGCSLPFHLPIFDHHAPMLLSPELFPFQVPCLQIQFKILRKLLNVSTMK